MQTTGGRLLLALGKESITLLHRVLLRANLSPERAEAVVNGSLRLSLEEQHRLANATLEAAPQFIRLATRLRDQALTARSYESQEFVERHRDPPSRS